MVDIKRQQIFLDVINRKFYFERQDIIASTKKMEIKRLARFKNWKIASQSHLVAKIVLSFSAMLFINKQNQIFIRNISIKGAFSASMKIVFPV